MTALLLDPLLEEDLIAHRRAAGIDKFDEVWDGVYVMSPLANDEHQSIVGDLTTILNNVVGWPGLGDVRPGVNVSDRKDDWKSNYRCPDIAVFLKGTVAENCDTFWCGGPDLAIEIVSPGDRIAEKLPFYAATGTRELLVVDREPWALRSYRLQDDKLVEVGVSTVAESLVLGSEVVPLSWQLVTDESRPAIRVAHADGQQHWLIRSAQP